MQAQAEAAHLDVLAQLHATASLLDETLAVQGNVSEAMVAADLLLRAGLTSLQLSVALATASTGSILDGLGIQNL